jgi:hypothetical protein
VKMHRQRRDDDCLRCAIASVMDVPYGHTPRSRPTVVGSHVRWWGYWNAWAKRRNQRIILVGGKPPKDWLDLDDFWIAVVAGDFLNHAVIFKGRKFWDDPQGLFYSRLKDVLSYVVLEDL